EYLEANKYNNPIWEVENLINNADLVIGLGRSAFEAMACGRPVIIFDERNYFLKGGDGYIGEKVGLSLKNNCSGRYFKEEFNKQKLAQELRKYKKEDSIFFREVAEKEFDVIKNVDRYFDYYYKLKKNQEKNRL